MKLKMQKLYLPSTCGSPGSHFESLCLSCCRGNQSPAALFVSANQFTGTPNITQSLLRLSSVLANQCICQVMQLKPSNAAPTFSKDVLATHTFRLSHTHTHTVLRTFMHTPTSHNNEAFHSIDTVERWES